jgi:hypothetical protein
MGRGCCAPSLPEGVPCTALRPPPAWVETGTSKQSPFAAMCWSPLYNHYTGGFLLFLDQNRRPPPHRPRRSPGDIFCLPRSIWWPSFVVLSTGWQPCTLPTPASAGSSSTALMWAIVSEHQHAHVQVKLTTTSPAPGQLGELQLAHAEMQRKHIVATMALKVSCALLKELGHTRRQLAGVCAFRARWLKGCHKGQLQTAGCNEERAITVLWRHNGQPSRHAVVHQWCLWVVSQAVFSVTACCPPVTCELRGSPQAAALGAGARYAHAKHSARGSMARSQHCGGTPAPVACSRSTWYRGGPDGTCTHHQGCWMLRQLHARKRLCCFGQAAGCKHVLHSSSARSSAAHPCVRWP